MTQTFRPKSQTLITSLLLALSTSVSANIEKHCERYAGKAVEQQQRNLDQQCNLSGPRWNSDREGQYQWCLTVNPQITNNENLAREKMLQACLQQKMEKRVAAVRSVSTPGAEENLGIATACLDPDSGYVPVEYLLSKKTTYQQEPALYRPVLSKNGVITHDFNGDRQPDYLFVEKNKSSKARLTTCISEGAEGGYKRTPSKVEMHEFKAGEDIWNYEISFSYGKLNVSETTFLQPLGASSKVSIYSFDPELDSFVMEARNQMTISNDGATGTSSEQYDLVNKTYREILDCNNVPAELRALCKPFQRSGELILPDKLPTLADSDPVLYLEKIPE